MSANDRQPGGTHYVSQPIQTWDFINENGIGFIAGNVIKYVARYEKKGGLEDLRKAEHYLEKLIEVETEKLLTGLEPRNAALGAMLDIAQDPNFLARSAKRKPARRRK